jgi:hypothetical protein
VAGRQPIERGFLKKLQQVYGQRPLFDVCRRRLTRRLPRVCHCRRRQGATGLTTGARSARIGLRIDGCVTRWSCGTCDPGGMEQVCRTGGLIAASDDKRAELGDGAFTRPQHPGRRSCMRRIFSIDDLMRRPRADGDRGRALRPRTPRSLVTAGSSTAALWPVVASLGSFAAAQAMGRGSHPGFAGHPRLFSRRTSLSRASVIPRRPFVPLRSSVYRRVVVFGRGFIAHMLMVPVDPAQLCNSYFGTYYHRTYYHPYRPSPRYPAYL